MNKHFKIKKLISNRAIMDCNEVQLIDCAINPVDVNYKAVDYTPRSVKTLPSSSLTP